MEIALIREHYEIRFKDIDPDTGDVSQDLPIALSMSENNARWVLEALTREWFDLNGANDPNREFYIIKREDIKL